MKSIWGSKPLLVLPFLSSSSIYLKVYCIHVYLAHSFPLYPIVMMIARMFLGVSFAGEKPSHNQCATLFLHDLKTSRSCFHRWMFCLV